MTLAPSNSPIGAALHAHNIVADLGTGRLDLISITPAMLHADFARSLNFPGLIQADVPAGWPPEGWDEDAYNYLLKQMEKHPHLPGWSRYIAVKRAQGRTLAGGCGLLQPVELTDDPEIGYGLLPEYQHLGYATEAVGALVEWIFAHPHVRSVNGQTFPSHEPSLRVLARSGFHLAGPGREEGTILFRKMRA